MIKYLLNFEPRFRVENLSFLFTAETTSIRSGLRKRKRAESPQEKKPQATEEWIDEDKLELWEIKQYGEKQERQNAQVITRTTTGKLPPPKQMEAVSTTANGTSQSTTTTTTKNVILNKASPEEIKEKMETQLRIQRAAHNQKRALEMKQGL